MSTSYASRGPSHRLVRYLPYLAALVLVAGGIAALIAFLGNTVHPVGPAPSAKPAVLPEQQKTVPLAAGSWLDKAAQLYGRRFEPDGSA